MKSSWKFGKTVMPMPPAIIMICEKFLPIYRSDSSNPSHASSTGGSGPPLPTSKSKPFGGSLSIPLGRVALEVLGELAEVVPLSDGSVLSTNSATKLTGFQFEPLLPANTQRRTLITDFAHPLTAGLKADTVIGGPLAYGPALYPKDGKVLGTAWTKQGRNYAGLSVKSFGRGARGASTGKEPLGGGDWVSVFTTAVPIPADLWRNLARYAGAHVYAESNDILMADGSIVALHSIQSGPKRLALPELLRKQPR